MKNTFSSLFGRQFLSLEEPLLEIKILHAVKEIIT